MNEYFHVGEIAILQNGVHYPELNGTEVTITDGLDYRKHTNSNEIILCYITDFVLENGMYLAAQPHQLRKKFDKGSWNECMFKPKEKENV